jgi:hypothetical protein
MEILGKYYQQVKEFHGRHEKLLIPTVLVLGFLFDYFTFANVEIWLSFGFLVTYWVVASLAIIFVRLYDKGMFSEKFKHARFVAFLLLQFAFGGLLKGVLVFYWFSAAFSVSWPLFALIIFLALFNDVFRDFFSRITVQLTLYFFITFALVAVMLPFIFNSISPWLFVIAGVASVVFFFAYVFLLSFATPFERIQKVHIAMSVIIITAVMNAFYFANIIPPIPLAIREAGVYRSLKSLNGAYIMTAEPETFWQKLIPGQTLHFAGGGKVYIYTAIFAPAQLNATIVHDWQYYDKTKKTWVDVGELPFTILGGREGGYKGYSWMSNLAFGDWRVYVESARGQVLGKISFTVENAKTPVKLEQVSR